MGLGQVVLQAGVAELVDRAGLAQYAAPVGVVEEGDDGPGQASGQGQPDPGEYEPLAPGGHGERVSEGAAEATDGSECESGGGAPDEWTQ